jgi:hypothetical protein
VAFDGEIEVSFWHGRARGVSEIILNCNLLVR